MAEYDNVEMLGDDESLFISPVAKAYALAQNVRKNPALATPSTGVQAPRPAPVAPASPAAPTAPQPGTSAHTLSLIGDRLGERPDPQQYIDYRQQRNEGALGKHALGLTLAAMGGETLSPFGKQYSEQAMKEGGDYEIPGGWGVVTDSGVIWNQEKIREEEQKRLEARYRAQLAAETSAQNSRDRADALKATRDAAAAQRGATQDQQRFRLEDSMRNHFDQVTSDSREINRAVGNAGLLPQTGKLNAAQQGALIYIYNKLLDPNSVVREGEYDRVKAMQGVMQRWGNWPQQIMSGQQLSPGLVKDLQVLLKEFGSANDAYMRRVARSYIDNAARRGYDVRQVVTDPRLHEAPAQGSPGGRGTANSPLEIRRNPGGATDRSGAVESSL